MGDETWMGEQQTTTQAVNGTGLMDGTDTTDIATASTVQPGESAEYQASTSIKEKKMESSTTTDMTNLFEDISRLSLSSDHMEKPLRRATAQSVIAKIAELRLKPPGPSLVSHAPHSTTPLKSAKKRGGTDYDSNAIKHSRVKEPSEQDERVGEYNESQWLNQPQSDAMMNILLGLTDDVYIQSEIMDDVVSFDVESQIAFSKYLEQKNVSMPESPQSPVLYDNQVSPVSGYETDDDRSHASPYSLDLYPSSPAFSDTAEGIIASPKNILPNSEYFINISDDNALSQCGNAGAGGTNIQPMNQPYLQYPPTNSITLKQMNQVQQTHILDGVVIKQQQQQSCAQNGKIAPPLSPATPSTGQASPGSNCGCGVASCQHRNIAPKNMHLNSPQLVPTMLSHPIQIPAHIPTISEVIDQLPKDELICARRWVASIKTEDLKKSDKDGDLALHIVVTQYDLPKLIALLERCRRENIVHEVINKTNICTQTLLFLALVAAPSDDKAADMISILLEYGADPLVRTILHSNNSIDNRYCCPVHIVAQKGNSALPIMRRLLTREAPAQLIVGCDSKQTALHYAARENQYPSDQMVYELIRQGADINLREGKRGRTPLHYLLETQNVGLVGTVLHLVGGEKAKQAVQVPTYDGCTALHIAAALRISNVEQHKQLLKLLLTNGAETSTKNSQNQKAIDLIPKEHRELSSILKANPSKSTYATS